MNSTLTSIPGHFGSLFLQTLQEILGLKECCSPLEGEWIGYLNLIF
ncbi:hypothetical protein MJ1HA_1126 [Metallosphaera sedula]|nr:hypothetical protein MJ1HA_1126 [Metallosphaera sedula]